MAVGRKRPDVAGQRRAGQRHGCARRRGYRNRRRRCAGRRGQAQFERRGEGHRRAADEHQRRADRHRNDVPGRRIDGAGQGDRDLVQRIDEVGRPCADRRADHHRIGSPAIDRQAPRLAAQRIPAQAQRNRLAGRRRRDHALGRRRQRHQRVGSEGGAAAFDHVQGRAGEEGGESGAGARLDRLRQGRPDLIQSDDRAADGNDVLRPVDGDHPAIAGLRCPCQGEARRRAVAHDRDGIARRRYRQRHRQARGEGQRIAQLQRARTCRRHHAGQYRIGRCLDGVAQSGGDKRQRVAGTHRIADRRLFAADTYAQHPLLSCDDRAGKGRRRCRRGTGRQAAGARAAVAIDDEQRAAFRCRQQRRGRRGIDGGGQCRGNLVQRIDQVGGTGTDRRAYGDRVGKGTNGDGPVLAEYRCAGKREADRGCAATVDNHGTAGAGAELERNAQADRRPRQGGRPIHHDHGAAESNCQVARCHARIDRSRQPAGHRRQRVGGADRQGEEMACHREVPAVALDQGAGKHGRGGGAPHFVDRGGRVGRLGDDAQRGLEAGTGDIDDDQDVAVGRRNEAGELGRLADRVIVAGVDVACQRGGDLGHRRRAAAGIHEHLGKLLAVDHDGPGIAMDRRAGERDQRGGCRPGVDGPVGDAQRVGAGRGLDVDRLHFGDRRHAHAGQAGPGQAGNAAVVLGAVIDVQRVGPGTADDGQQRVDRLQLVGGRRRQVRRGGAADTDAVIAVTGIDGGVAGDRLDVDAVVAAAAGQVGGAGVGREDREGVVAAAEPDIEDFQILVDDAARQDAAGDHGVAAHAEAGQVVRGKDADVIGGTAGVVDVQRIDLVGLVDPGIQVDRLIEVVVALHRSIELADLDDRDLPDRRHIDGGGELGSGQVGDHKLRTPGGRREGHDAACNDALAQFPGHVGEGFAGLDHVRVGGAEGGIVEDDGPHFARKQRARCQVDHGGGSGDRGIGSGAVGELEAGPGPMDDKQPGAVGQGDEIVRSIDVDGGGQAGSHRAQGFGGHRRGRIVVGIDQLHYMAVLCRGHANAQQHRVALAGHSRSGQGHGGRRGMQRAPGGGEARIGRPADLVNRSGGGTQAIDDDQRAVVGDGREVGTDHCIDAFGQRRGDVRRRFAGANGMEIIVSAQCDLPYFAGRGRPGKRRRPGIRRRRVRLQLVVAAGRRTAAVVCGQHGEVGTESARGVHQDQAAAFDRCDVARRDGSSGRIDRVRQGLGDAGQRVVTERVVAEGERRSAGRCKRHGPFLAGHRRADQFDGPGAAGRHDDIVEVGRAIDGRGEADAGVEGREARAAALDDHQRVVRHDRVVARQRRRRDAIDRDAVDPVAEDGGQGIQRVGQDLHACGPGAKGIGLADGQAEPVANKGRGGTDRQRPDFAGMWLPRQGYRGRAEAVGHRARLQGSRRRRDAEAGGPGRAVAGHDCELVAFGHRRQHGRSAGVDQAREAGSDQGLHLLDGIPVGVDAGIGIVGADRKVEDMVDAARIGQRYAPGVAGGGRAVEYADECGRRGIDRMAADRLDRRQRRYRAGGQVEDHQRGAFGDGRVAIIGGVGADHAGQCAGDFAQAIDGPADHHRVIVAAQRHGPLFAREREAGQIHPCHRRRRARGARQRRRYGDGGGEHRALAVGDEQDLVFMACRVHGGVGVVRIHQGGEALRNVGQRSHRARDRHRVGLSAEAQRPDLADHRIADQRDQRRARGRRIDCRDSGRRHGQAGRERGIATAEQPDLAGDDVCRVRAARIRIHLIRQGRQDVLQRGAGGDAVGRNRAARDQLQHPVLTGDNRGCAHLQGHRLGHGLADGAGGNLDVAVGRGECAAVAIDDEQGAVAGDCRVGLGVRIGRIVEQRRQRRRNLGRGIARERGVGHGCRSRADGNGGGEPVSRAHGRADRGARRRRRRCGFGQGTGFGDRVARGECRSGAIDDVHLVQDGDRREVGLTLGIDGGRQPGGDFGQGRQAHVGGCRIAVEGYQADGVAGRTGGRRRTGAFDQGHAPDLAVDRGAGKVERVGVGGRRRAGAGGEAARAAAGGLRDREARSEGAAVGLDDDEQAAVAGGEEGGGIGIRAVVDDPRQRRRHRLASLAGGHRVGEFRGAEPDAVYVAGERRARERGPGGCRSREAAGGVERGGGRDRREIAGGQCRPARTGDDQAIALGPGGEAARAAGDRQCQRLGDLAQRVHHHQPAAEVPERADDDVEIHAVQGHAPGVVGHRTAGEIDHEGGGRHAGGERPGRRHRECRREAAGTRLGHQEAGALGRGSEVAGQRGIDCGRQAGRHCAQRLGGHRCGRVAVGIDQLHDVTCSAGATHVDRPGFTGHGRAGQGDVEGLDRGGNHRRRGRHAARLRHGECCREAAIGPAGDQQRVAFDHGREVRQGGLTVDPGGKPGGQQRQRRVGRVDRQRLRHAGHRQGPGFTSQGSSAKADLGRRRRGRAGHRIAADRKGCSGDVGNDDLRALGGRGVVRQQVYLRREAGRDLGSGPGNAARAVDPGRGSGIGNDDQRRARTAGQPGAQGDHAARRAGGDHGRCGDALYDETRAERLALAIHHHQLRAVGDGGELAGLGRRVGIDGGGQARCDLLRALARGCRDREDDPGDGQLPDFALRRRALQRNHAGARRDVAEGGSLHHEAGRETARAATNDDDFGTLGNRGDAAADAGRDAQRQRGGDVLDRLAGDDDVRHRTRHAVEVEADGPGVAHHRRPLQRQQRNTGGAVVAGRVGIDDIEIGKGKAVTGAIDHDQRGAVAGGREFARRCGVDGPCQSRCRGLGRFRVVAAGDHGIGDDGGKVVADQRGRQGLANGQGSGQRRDACGRIGGSDAQRTGRQDRESGGEGNAVALDHHEADT